MILTIFIYFCNYVKLVNIVFDNLTSIWSYYIRYRLQTFVCFSFLLFIYENPYPDWNQNRKWKINIIFNYYLYVICHKKKNMIFTYCNILWLFFIIFIIYIIIFFLYIYIFFKISKKINHILNFNKKYFLSKSGFEPIILKRSMNRKTQKSKIFIKNYMFSFWYFQFFWPFFFLDQINSSPKINNKKFQIILFF